MARRRIGFLITGLGLGGAEKAVALAAAGLSREGFDVSIASLRGTEPYGPRLEAAGVPVADLAMRGRFDLGVVRRCRDWIRERRLEILHAYLFHAQVVSRLVRPARDGCLLLNSQRLSGMESVWRRGVLRATAGAVDRFTAISEDTKKYLVDRLGVPAGRIEVIPNGIDLAEFDASAGRGDAGAPPLPAGVPLVGTVGQMWDDRQKGYPVLLAALARVLARRPVHLVVCGDGPGRMEVESEVARLALGRSVTLLGERRDVPAVLSSLDLYVQASRWEGFPNAILEAMAARLPVAATRVGGVPELVVDGGTGALAARGDPDALADAILGLLADPAAARRMGEVGRARVEERFTAAHVVAAHGKLYRRLLAGRGDD